MVSHRVTRSVKTTEGLQSLTDSNSSDGPINSSPFLPTRLEQVLIAIYPATLLLGSLFSILNPTNRAAPYSAESQSHPPSHAPSYFAHKSNVFNRYFVKIGWFWTTLALVAFVVSHSSFRSSNVSTLKREQRLVHVLTRYTIITLLWTAMTQWFLGPPLIDRGFRFTGGQCELLAAADDPGAREVDMSQARKALTHAACRAVGGSWRGGHDISGHVFILILGSAMLWFEILPAVLVAAGAAEDRVVRLTDGRLVNASVEGTVMSGRERQKEVSKPPPRLGAGLKFVLSVAGLSWWMLLMTAAYFHTWFEKFTGLVVAFAAIAGVYFLPRGLPAFRYVVGMPGV